MRKWVINFFCLLLLMLLSSCSTGGLSNDNLITEEFKIPGSFKGNSGTYIANLDAEVIRPNDGLRHPLAVINHGTNGHNVAARFPNEMRGMALEFVRRGWVVVLFTRRGFGRSEGVYEEGITGHTADVYEQAGRAASSDIREAILYMEKKSYVNAAQVISVGESTGGFATVALTVHPPPGLVAAINFAGGRGSFVKGSDSLHTVYNEPAEIEAFQRYGKKSRIPMLWVYAENDSVFAPALVRQFYAAFTEAGGKAELIEAPAWGSDGHDFFRYSTDWIKYVDDFLMKQNLTDKQN